jgi:hypothetical protein
MKKIIAKKKILFIVLIASLITLPLLIVECGYRYGLHLFRELPSVQAYQPLPSIVTNGIWASFSEKAPPRVKPLMPWNILEDEVLGCDSPGAKITNYVSRRLLEIEGPSPRMLTWHLQEFSLTVWLSRNWPTERIIHEAGNQIVICREASSIDKLANKLFDKNSDALEAHEIALIMAAGKGGFVHAGESLQNQLLKRRNQILERMLKNGAISEGDYTTSRNQPITSLQQDLIECRN